MSGRAKAVQVIAEVVHSNESMHRHRDLHAASCVYCDLVARYAVRALVADPGLLAELAEEAELSVDGSVTR